MPVPGEMGHIEAHDKWNAFVQDARAGKVRELVGPRGPQGPKGAQGERGLQGEVGPAGPRGQGIDFKGSYDTYAEFIAAHPIGEPGDIYLVAESLYVWNSTTNSWEDEGSLRGPAGPTGPQGPAGKDGVAAAERPVTYDSASRTVGLMTDQMGMLTVGPVSSQTGPGLTVNSGPVPSIADEDLGVEHDAARVELGHNKTGQDAWITKYTDRLSINASDYLVLGVGDDVSASIDINKNNEVGVLTNPVSGQALTVGGKAVAESVETPSLNVNGKDVSTELSNLSSRITNNAAAISGNTTEIGKKADESWVQSELDLKADAATVTSELAKKADTQTVDNQLSNKMNDSGGTFTGPVKAASASGNICNIFISSDAPSGGADGDVWLRY